MLYIILCILCVSRSNHHCSWKFHKFHRKTPVLESLFFFKLMKLYNIIWHLFCMNKPYFCRNFFLIDWCHKRLKNKIDLLLFYEEHLIYEKFKKKHSFHNKYIYIHTVTDILKFYEVLFCTYCKGLFCL